MCKCLHDRPPKMCYLVDLCVNCKALNLGVDFFLPFYPPNSGVTFPLSFFFSQCLVLFQSSSEI
jgi:hypothetical protein